MITQHEHKGKQITTVGPGVEGALFDLDGTITNNALQHFESWQQFLANYSVNITQEDFYAQYIGKTSRQIFKELLGELSSTDEDRLFNERFNLYKQSFRETGTEIPGLIPLLTSLGEAGIKCAVVTSSSQPTRDLHLDHLNLRDYFNVIVGAEDVAKEQLKPHPEPYLRTLRQLSVAARNCLVFEDSPTGVKSAVSANIPTIGVLSTHTAEELREEGVVATIKDYTNVRLVV